MQDSIAISWIFPGEMFPALKDCAASWPAITAAAWMGSLVSMSGFHDGVCSRFEFTPRSAIFNFALIPWTPRCLADGLTSTDSRAACSRKASFANSDSWECPAAWASPPPRPLRYLALRAAQLRRERLERNAGSSNDR